VDGLEPGTYSVSQADPTPGFDLTAISCDDEDSSGDPGSRSATFIVDPGETVTCTFSNTQRGTIVVEVQTDPDGEAGEFSFTGDAAGTIADGEIVSVSDLPPGGYAVTGGDTTPYFALSAITCDDENSSGDVGERMAAFELDPGETVTCTFAYTRNPRIYLPLLVGGIGA